ncbi:MAG: hypothetical protein AB4290_26580 [Spirulina sp.]
MKKRVLVSLTSILFLGLMIAGFGVEFLATAVADPNSCAMSPHNQGCENDLPIDRDQQEGEELALENYFISETLSDYFSSELLSESLKSEYLAGYFSE